MSVFGNMMSKIFGRAGASSGSSAAGSTTVAAGTGPAQVSETQASPGASGGGVQSEVKQNVDVAAVLDGLASELHYSGDTNDSASMNIWLHKQVMQKLAENGGKVPDELKH